LNPTFNIQAANINTSNADLYLTIDANGLSFIILEEGVSRALVIYHFEAGTSITVVDHINDIITDHPVLQQKFKKVHIIYGYPVSVLVPQQFINSNNHSALLELVFGDTNDMVLRTELLEKKSLTNIYGVPAEIEQVLSRYFEFAESGHIYSLLPGVADEAGHHLYCIFGTGELKAIVIKDGQLQAMQNFCYKTPEDVIYHLLNCCKCFDIDPDEIDIRLSGMIDESSPLYKELYKYFLLLNFDVLPEKFEYPEEIKQFPEHYFSHLYSLAACV
jgi:hypothetical protein